MYYKTPKKEEHGYHFGTVNVLPKKSKERLTEIEKCYAAVCDGVSHNSIKNFKTHKPTQCPPQIFFLHRVPLCYHPDLLNVLENFTARGGAGKLTSNATNFVNEPPGLGICCFSAI
jgi:hypothetical protein